MDLDAEAVPHFFAENDPERANRVMVDWLAEHRLVPFYSLYAGDAPLDDILEIMGEQNPTAHYILFGNVPDGKHAVVCRGGKVVHDPNWFHVPMIAGTADDYWTILVLARG
jgi:hypothetical protein